MPAGTGVLLNDEMDDFTIAPDVPNGYQLRSGVANRIEPHKRPLSSMTPTFVEDARGVLVLGAPGGSRIISQVLLGVLDYLQQREVDLESIVRAPRYHHQFWPDRVEIEPDAAMGTGDLRIAWRDGAARRDIDEIWDAVVQALGIGERPMAEPAPARTAGTRERAHA